MSLQAHYEFASEAAHQAKLAASDEFDQLVYELSRIPAFVDESLQSGDGLAVDRITRAYAECRDVDAVIEGYVAGFAEQQARRARASFKSYADLVSEWKRHQASRDQRRAAA